MAVKDWLLPEDEARMVELRRTIHRHPELLFDLPVTQALVKAELEAMGIETDTHYAPGSVVGYINKDCKGRTVALRADMDALPIEEKTGFDFSSEIPGVMHACGHDEHTAILLTVARILKRHEKELPMRVKLLFQPSEEGIESGAKLMSANGVLDDVDLIVGQHCENELETGQIGYCPGPYMAAGVPINLYFLGKSAHVTLPEQGVDAIAMAMEAYEQLKAMAKEEAELFAVDGKPADYLFAIGMFAGGSTHNIICDNVEIRVSFRHFNKEFSDHYRSRGLNYLRQLCDRYGGDFKENWITSCPAVMNDPALTEQFHQTTEHILPGHTVEITKRLSSEDFAWFQEKKPGFLFRFGTRNEEMGCTTLAHCSDFKPDEGGMKYAVWAFLNFVMENGGFEA